MNFQMLAIILSFHPWRRANSQVFYHTQVILLRHSLCAPPVSDDYSEHQHQPLGPRRSSDTYQVDEAMNNLQELNSSPLAQSQTSDHLMLLKHIEIASASSRRCHNWPSILFCRRGTHTMLYSTLYQGCWCGFSVLDVVEAANDKVLRNPQDMDSVGSEAQLTARADLHPELPGASTVR